MNAQSRELHGRTIIFTDYTYLDSSNILEVLRKTILIHDKNAHDIEYLYNYSKGKQAIDNKTKDIRPEINHKVCENRANEILTFKLGYVFGEPVQYIRRGEEDYLTDELEQFNDYMYLSDKYDCDDDLAMWSHICGVGYRMTLANNDDENPLVNYSLDPRFTFTIKCNGLGKKTLAGVTFIENEDQSRTYYIYTDDFYFKVKNDMLVEVKPNTLGIIPIIEYPLNETRMGVFEVVLPLLDAINEVQSNRLDDIEQFVNSFLAVMGGELDQETVDKLNEWKMLCLPEGTDAKYISDSLKQSDIQVLVDNLYQDVLTICGMPNRNGGRSTSDTGAAVQLRDGWENAEAQAKLVEKYFKKSERQFLKLALKIIKDTVGSRLKLSNIEIKFARRYTDNLANKCNALTQLLNVGINPEIAITTCGIWSDPSSVYMASKPYLEQWEVKEDELNVRNDGQEAEETSNGDTSTIQEN